MENLNYTFNIFAAASADSAGQEKIDQTRYMEWLTQGAGTTQGHTYELLWTSHIKGQKLMTFPDFNQLVEELCKKRYATDAKGRAALVAGLISARPRTAAASSDVTREHHDAAAAIQAVARGAITRTNVAVAQGILSSAPPKPSKAGPAAAEAARAQPGQGSDQDQDDDDDDDVELPEELVDAFIYLSHIPGNAAAKVDVDSVDRGAIQLPLLHKLLTTAGLEGPVQRPTTGKHLCVLPDDVEKLYIQHCGTKVRRGLNVGGFMRFLNDMGVRAFPTMPAGLRDECVKALVTTAAAKVKDT